MQTGKQISKPQMVTCTEVQRPWGRNVFGVLEEQEEAGGLGLSGSSATIRRGSWWIGQGWVMQASGQGR